MTTLEVGPLSFSDFQSDTAQVTSSQDLECLMSYRTEDPHSARPGLYHFRLPYELYTPSSHTTLA